MLLLWKYLFCYGIQSRKFLKCIPQLETLLLSEGPEEISKGMPLIKVLSLFDRVVETCFGMTLKPEYQEAILAFKEAYMELGVTVTPKVLKYSI